MYIRLGPQVYRLNDPGSEATLELWYRTYRDIWLILFGEEFRLKPYTHQANQQPEPV